MVGELKDLPKPEKKVAAKVLSEMGYSSRRLEELLGLHRVTAWRATKLTTPKELKQFEADFIVAIKQMQQEGVGLIYTRLLELIPKERRIDQIVKAGEFLENRNTPQTLIQQNISQKMELELKDDDFDAIAGELPE